MGKAQQNLLIHYKNHLRKKEVKRTLVEVQGAVVAAGVYKDSVPALNTALAEYVSVINMDLDPKQYRSASAQEENKLLYEEWKQIFGKMEDKQQEN